LNQVQEDIFARFPKKKRGIAQLEP